MGKTICMSLDPDSIRAAAREIDAYRREFENKIKHIMHELAISGAIEATSQLNMAVVEYDGKLFDGIETGALADSIYGVYDPDSHTGFIRAGEGLTSKYGITYAFYVEYGTGYAGENNPHPNPGVWEYDVNGHGEEGWMFGHHWTNGRPAMPFMYNTGKELKSICKRLAKEVFGGV